MSISTRESDGVLGFANECSQRGFDFEHKLACRYEQQHDHLSMRARPNGSDGPDCQVTSAQSLGINEDAGVA